MNKLENKTPKWFWFFAIPFMILVPLGLLQINSIFGDEMPEPIWAKIGYVLGIIGIFFWRYLYVLKKKVSCLDPH